MNKFINNSNELFQVMIDQIYTIPEKMTNVIESFYDTAISFLMDTKINNDGLDKTINDIYNKQISSCAEYLLEHKNIELSNNDKERLESVIILNKLMGGN
ncbi:MAG: hypothetical protein ACOC2W_00830 [bacterium]